MISPQFTNLANFPVGSYDVRITGTLFDYQSIVRNDDITVVVTADLNGNAVDPDNGDCTSEVFAENLSPWNIGT